METISNDEYATLRLIADTALGILADAAAMEPRWQKLAEYLAHLVSVDDKSAPPEK